MAYVAVGQDQAPPYENHFKRKPVQFTKVPEVDLGDASSYTSTRSWTKSSFTSQPLEPDRVSLRSSITNSVALSKTGSWTFEIVSLVLAFGSIASIVAVLAHFDGHALPDWPYHITLNALIAVLATIANANLAVTIQSGISQLKWIRFKAGRTPLTDMELFDEASRGTWGALKLLATARGGLFGSFGAAVAIVALAIAPFAQQVVTYNQHTIESSARASIPKAWNYTGYLSGANSSTFVPELPMKAAIYHGLFAESIISSLALPVNCPTGNCTFAPYSTLAVCQSCTNITDQMTRYCASGTPADGNYSSCGWQLPTGARLNSSYNVFSMKPLFPSPSGDMPHSTIIRLDFMGTELQNGTPGALNPWALECSFEACVTTMASTVMNGNLSESITNTFLNESVLDITKDTRSAVLANRAYIQTPANETYFLSGGVILALRSWFSVLFAEGSSSFEPNANPTASDNTVAANYTVGISSGLRYFDSDIIQAFYWNYYQYQVGIPKLMQDLSVAMTITFRSESWNVVPVSGISTSIQSFVHVRWVFITVPVLVVLLTGIFLASAILRSQQSNTKLWKSSALAMLFHGLDQDTRASFGRTGSLDEKRKRAKDIRVQLDDSSEYGSLLRI